MSIFLRTLAGGNCFRCLTVRREFVHIVYVKFLLLTPSRRNYFSRKGEKRKSDEESLL